ncbi:unnamed protein product [Orchesella dallaii]|uniref:Uncharacterized protein n=1 Tax=Orchesella dallaii TaxID=48710 RepID=A0ABP1Q8Q3_9HEXA
MAKNTIIILTFLATSIGFTFLSMASVMSAAAAQIPIPHTTEILSNEINGNNIVNTPNRNSSSAFHDFPWKEVRQNRKSRIGHKCDTDADCGNFSICVLRAFEEDLTVKVCQCDSNEMKRVNYSCFTKPGHQCYYPDVNEHGYRYIQCHPRSTCRTSVNKTSPGNGYCMCNMPDLDMHYREVDKEFEMAHCAGSFIMNGFTNPYFSLVFTVIVISFQKLLNTLTS